jgi:hypothetical protein
MELADIGGKLKVPAKPSRGRLTEADSPAERRLRALSALGYTLDPIAFKDRKRDWLDDGRLRGRRFPEELEKGVHCLMIDRKGFEEQSNGTYVPPEIVLGRRVVPGSRPGNRK